MAKHTEGPWHACGSETNLSTWVSAGPCNGATSRRICSMKQSEQDWANAQLIAAAPDLLHSLQSCLAMLDQRHWVPDEVAKARAAIARATA